jgi:hypothetical protein
MVTSGFGMGVTKTDPTQKTSAATGSLIRDARNRFMGGPNTVAVYEMPEALARGIVASVPGVFAPLLYRGLYNDNPGNRACPIGPLTLDGDINTRLDRAVEVAYTVERFRNIYYVWNTSSYFEFAIADGNHVYAIQNANGAPIGDFFVHGEDRETVGIFDSQGRQLGASNRLSVYRVPVISTLRNTEVAFGAVEYEGCYVDRVNDRVFKTGAFRVGTVRFMRLEVALCIAMARNRRRFGMQAETELWLPLNDSDPLKYGIAGNGSARDERNRFLGGPNVMSVYTITSPVGSVRPYFMTRWGKVRYYGFYIDEGNRAVPDGPYGLGGDLNNRLERAMEIAFTINRTQTANLDWWTLHRSIRFGIEAGNEVWMTSYIRRFACVSMQTVVRRSGCTYTR